MPVAEGGKVYQCRTEEEKRPASANTGEPSQKVARLHVLPYALPMATTSIRLANAPGTSAQTVPFIKTMPLASTSGFAPYMYTPSITLKSNSSIAQNPIVYPLNIANPASFHSEIKPYRGEVVDYEKIQQMGKRMKPSLQLGEDLRIPLTKMVDLWTDELVKGTGKMARARNGKTIQMCDLNAFLERQSK